MSYYVQDFKYGPYQVKKVYLNKKVIWRRSNSKSKLINKLHSTSAACKYTIKQAQNVYNIKIKNNTFGTLNIIKDIAYNKQILQFSQTANAGIYNSLNLVGKSQNKFLLKTISDSFDSIKLNGTSLNKIKLKVSSNAHKTLLNKSNSKYYIKINSSICPTNILSIKDKSNMKINLLKVFCNQILNKMIVSKETLAIKIKSESQHKQSKQIKNKNNYNLYLKNINYHVTSKTIEKNNIEHNIIFKSFIIKTLNRNIKNTLNLKITHKSKIISGKNKILKTKKRLNICCSNYSHNIKNLKEKSNIIFKLNFKTFINNNTSIFNKSKIIFQNKIKSYINFNIAKIIKNKMELTFNQNSYIHNISIDPMLYKSQHKIMINTYLKRTNIVELSKNTTSIKFLNFAGIKSFYNKNKPNGKNKNLFNLKSNMKTYNRIKLYSKQSIIPIFKGNSKNLNIIQIKTSNNQYDIQIKNKAIFNTFPNSKLQNLTVNYINNKACSYRYKYHAPFSNICLYYKIKTQLIKCIQFFNISKLNLYISNKSSAFKLWPSIVNSYIYLTEEVLLDENYSPINGNELEINQIFQYNTYKDTNNKIVLEVLPNG